MLSFCLSFLINPLQMLYTLFLCSEVLFDRFWDFFCPSYFLGSLLWEHSAFNIVNGLVGLFVLYG